MERKTPLYDLHVAEGGKIVPFAGYLLPVQYGTGVIQEHMAVRQKAGLFDVSHMGEILFTGPTALDSLNHLLTNDYRNMPVNKVRYGVMCNAQGGTIDDLVVYKFGEESYLAVVNAANREKDYAHMAANVLEGTQCRDISDTVAQLALQGPKAPAILKKLLPEDQIPKGYYTALPNVDLQGIKCLISRTGYTGELGYEIYTSNEDAPKLWKLLREAGEEFGLIPCGLGARDTLRLEAAMPLYGHEMDETITPLEAGLDFGVKLDKAAFIGKDALVSALSSHGGHANGDHSHPAQKHQPRQHQQRRGGKAGRQPQRQPRSAKSRDTFKQSLAEAHAVYNGQKEGACRHKYNAENKDGQGVHHQLCRNPPAVHRNLIGAPQSGKRRC